MLHTQGGAHTRRCAHKVVYGHRRSLVISGGHGGWPPRRAKRAEAMGGLAVQTQGGAYARCCTHKAVHTQGGLWSPRQSSYLRGEAGADPPPWSEASQNKGCFDGPHRRCCTHKVVHTQGGAPTRWSMATVGVLLFQGGTGVGPRVGRSEPKQWVVWRSKHKAVHTQGVAHTRQCTHKVVYGRRGSLLI